MISIVIPAYNQLRLTINCISSVLLTHGIDFEVILVDDGSTESGYRSIQKIYPTIKKVTNSLNLGFIKSANKGILASSGEHILLLNNDVVIDNPAWLSSMFAAMQSRKLDMCAPAGGRLDSKFKYLNGEATKESDDFQYLPGWCLLFSRNLLDKIGPLDEQLGVGFWDDVDFSFRAKKAGLKLGIVPLHGVRHLCHQTFIGSGIDIKNQYNENRKLFLEKWKSEICM